ncbi:MAG: HAMP domain-containing sensor histidine kinase [Rhodocyclaceae bacterium]|nr:HAMP domain-containing sensor histidine kinase [Rhodocyclaceae bacterium]
MIFSATLFAYFLNWSLLLAWTMLLIGVAGGKVFLFPGRAERVFHLLALGYLTTVTLALVLPRSLATLNLTEPLLENLALYAAPAAFAIMALLPAEPGRMDERTEIVDYIYGVLVFLLLAVIVLGSLSFALVFKAQYSEALLVTLAFVSGVLMLLGFIWNPRAGFGGLSSAVAQHVMSLGLPIEGWLEFLSALSREEEDPERFLERACAELPQRLPGVVGVRWEGFISEGTSGDQQGLRLAFSRERPAIELITRISPGPALLWDYDLALRLLGEQYLGKRHAQELKRLSYVEAIHETGARLTHDVKNLLQSLETLCVAAQREAAVPSPRFSALLRRQLPEIAARLRQTLVKLAAPGQQAVQAEPELGSDWLKALEARYAMPWIRFSAAGDAAVAVIRYPGMFSSVAENLLQNIIDKRPGSPDLQGEVRLKIGSTGVLLEVEDNGTHIPEAVAERLLRQHVPSENGLGIGLYQSARLAEEYGYRLSLAENRDGCVRFRLALAA